MLSTTTCQVGFFDAAELIGPLPEGSFFSLLAEHGQRIVRDEDFAADCYSQGVGRPSIPQSQLAKVLLLQYRTGLSDEQAMEATAWDLRWKIALGLAVDHRGWNASTLTRFRPRLLLHGKESLALERSSCLAQELGMLDAPAERIVDSTPMLGAAATQDTVRLVRSGVRKLIDAVAATDKGSGRRLGFDYPRPSEKPDCRWRERSERERMLTRVAEDAERALRGSRQRRPARRGSRRGRPLPTARSDRPGLRRRSRRRDGPQAGALVDSQPAERCPTRLLGDTAYGTGPVRAELAEREIEVIAPVPQGPVKPGRLAKRDAVDLDAATVTARPGRSLRSERVPAVAARLVQAVSLP